MPILVIAAYHCEVAGDPTDSLDYQVRYFAADSIDEVMSRLRAESTQTYKNADGHEVRWLFDGTVAVEFDPNFSDGTEVIGFITGRRREITEQVAPHEPPLPVPVSRDLICGTLDSLPSSGSGGGR